MPRVQGPGGSGGGPAPPAPAVVYGPQDVGVWAADILRNIGAPHTQNNVNNIAAWWSCETGAAWGYGDTRRYNNLLNTAQFATYGVGTVPTSCPPCIPQFGNYNTGLWATLATLRMPRYAGVIQALRDDADRATFAGEVGASGWGTNGACIARSPAHAPLIAGTGLRPDGPAAGFGNGAAPAGGGSSGCGKAMMMVPVLLIWLVLLVVNLYQ